jgi:hypothetical protein
MDNLVTVNTNTEAETPNERIFNRVNAYYMAVSPIWKKALKAYNGGKDYLKGTLRKHPSETDEEFKERVDNSYNINLIKYSVKEFGNYIFSKTPRRNNANEEIVKDFDRQQKQVNEVMWNLFLYHNLCGLTWALVDMPQFKGTEVDIRTKQEQKIRPWCKVLSPLAVPDWCFDKFGNLEWVIIEEFVVEKDNPFAEPKLIKKRTLYTKTYYQVFSAVVTSPTTSVKNSGIRVGRRVKNNIGVVPVIPYSDLLFDRDFNTPEIADILTIYDAILAGESELLTNILKQTYGQLILPMSSHSMVSKVKARLSEAGIDPNSPATTAIITQEVGMELSRTKAIYEDADEKQVARYIQPAGATTESIINHNDRLLALTMKITGFLVGVSTTQRESADSKAVDNASLAAQLIRIASRLEEMELNIWKLFNMFDSTIAVPEVTYSKDYDIHEFKAVIAGLVELANINGGDNFKQQVLRTAVHAMDSIHRIPDETYAQIMDDIKSGKTSELPPTFSGKADYISDTSGSRPDNVRAKTDYDGSNEKIGKTQKL